MNLKNRFKRWLFPGLDLHTRCRYRWLPPLFLSGPIETLDVGFGNGAFSFAAARKGNRVTAVSMDQAQVDKARAFYDPGTNRIEFVCLNAYQPRGLGRQFDQIICLETLEHIRDDQGMARLFWDLLRPGGVLQLCCPNARHPMHNQGRTDALEDGGHVRDGYTLDSYRALVEPAGFVIETHLGIGGRMITAFDNVTRAIRTRGGDALALPVFLLFWPIVLALDRPNPKTPFSIHIIARKAERG